MWSRRHRNRTRMRRPRHNHRRVCSAAASTLFPPYFFARNLMLLNSTPRCRHARSVRKHPVQRPPQRRPAAPAACLRRNGSVQRHRRRVPRQLRQHHRAAADVGRRRRAPAPACAPPCSPATRHRAHTLQASAHLILASDCVFKESLVLPFLAVVKQVLSARGTAIVASEFRSASVHATFLKVQQRQALTPQC
jgi:hypothetical protein